MAISSQLLSNSFDGLSVVALSILQSGHMVHRRVSDPIKVEIALHQFEVKLSTVQVYSKADPDHQHEIPVDGRSVLSQIQKCVRIAVSICDIRNGYSSKTQLATII